jgi:transcriptional regulator with XRE-family HTH domain
MQEPTLSLTREERIKIRLARLGLSQARLAAKVHLSHKYLNNVLRGHDKSFAALEAMEAALDALEAEARLEAHKRRRKQPA